MQILKAILAVIQHPSHPTPGIQQPQGGGALGWDGDTPSLIPPGSALSPWIKLQKAQTVPYGVGHRGNPILNSSFQSAFAQVRSVGTVEKIDSYFQKYQMGHYMYQANAVMSHHTPPPGSTIPVVRTDPQDSGIEDVVDTMPSSSRDRRQQFTKNTLTDQELTIYKHALLCAQFPVLGSRLPRSALPSPSTVPSPHGGRGGASLLTSPPPSPGSLSLDGGGDEGDSMVQEETLCVLVKEAFGLSEERHLFYDDFINRGLGNKPPAKHLVEELMGRLSLLQTNSHPFYQPQDFETRNAYDLWQQQEGQRISALINRFWKGPLPNLDPSVCRASYWSSMHDMYQDLMVLLLKHDKVLKAGPSTGCPLLSSSRRLLREFHLQYGIGEVFRRVVYLECLSTKEWFESDDWFLKHISQSLLGIQDLLTKYQARVTMVRREYELLCRALTQLQERCCDLLEKILQERTPQSRVVSLITNLSDILALSAILLGRHQGNLEAIIVQSLKESVQNSYNAHKLRQTTELRLNAYSSPVSAELISKLIVHIQSEIQYIQENYQQLFQLYHVEIIESAASTFYSCLMADVSVLCDKIQVGQQENEQVIESVDPEMVAMARRLDRLDQAWKSYIPATAQQWRKSLTKSAVHWFQYLIRDVQAMIVYSICRDKFEAVHLTFTQDEEGSHSSYSSNHRPSNANPLTQSIGSAFASVIPKEQQGSRKDASDNNNTIRPKAATHSQQPDVSFNPSGVLNFKRPVRTQSFPQIKDLLDRSQQWSAAKKSGSEGLPGATRRTEDGASIQGGGGGDAFQPGGNGAFQPVNLRREARESLVNSNSSHHQLTHSQSFPELSTAAVAFGDMPGPSGVQDMVLPLPRDTFHDDYTSGKDQSTSTSRSRSNSSQHQSDRTYASDAEASTDTSSSGVSLARRQRREKLRAVFEQLGLFSGEGLRQSEIKLPISSSLVDMVYIMRHACSLMDDICSVLKPEMSAEMEEDKLQQRLLAADLQQLFISPLQGVTFAIRLFASNMLAMDLCATRVRDVGDMISKEVLNRVFIAQSAGLLGACRHERSGIADCNIYLNRKKDCLCDNFEPINPEMCLRINNVQGLIELLPDLLTDLDGSVAAKSSSSSSSSQTQATEGTKKQRPLQRYLHSLIVGQIKLLAYKVNQMLSEALDVLLQLDIGSSRIADRLHPVTACIHNHLVATSSWLYPQCYQVFCQELWKCIVKDFEKLVEELLMQRTEDRQRAMLLLQAIAHLMETMSNHSEHGLSADVFLEPADGVIQVLQLYTWPTARLIQLYQSLLQKVWKGTTTECWPVRRQTLRMLQRLLCQQRKCFTGNELLHALVYCHAEESQTENIWEWAYNTSEQLLRCGLVKRMMASGRTLDPTSPEGQGGQNFHFASQGEISDFEGYSFPEVTLHSITRTSRRNTDVDPTTTSEDTDGLSDKLSRRLQMIDDGRGSREVQDSESSDDGEARDGEVQHLEVLAEVYSIPSPSSPVRKEQPVIPSESACQSRDEADSRSQGPSVDVTTEEVASEVQAVMPSKSASQSMDDVRVEDGCHSPSADVTVKLVESEIKSVMPAESRDHHDDGSQGASAGVTNELVASEESSRDHAVTKDTEDEQSTLSMQTASGDELQGNVDSKGDGTEDKESVENKTCFPTGHSVTVKEKDQVDVDQDKHESDNSPAGEVCHSEDQSLRKDIAEAEGATRTSPAQIDMVVPCSEGVPQSEELEAPLVGTSKINAQEPERTEFMPSDTEKREECLHDGESDERVFRVIPDEVDTNTRRIDDDVRPDENMAPSRELGEKSPENIGINKFETVCSGTKEQSRTESPSGIRKQGSRVTHLSNTGAIARQTEEDERIQVTLRDKPQHPTRPYRVPTFSESSTSDQLDSDSSITPRAGSPVQRTWSPRGVVPAFTADSQQLYCFSQVYDPIPKEGAESPQESQPKSKSFQGMVENLDNGFSPEMVVTIIATRRDESSKDFINQLGDESLLTREASCIKRLCKACFTLR